MTQSAPLPTSIRHGYGFGALSLAIANTALMFFLAKYLVDGAGLSPAVAGLVVGVGKLWDAVTDPVIGALADRSRTSMGPRRPWLLVGAMPFGFLFALLWQGLPGEGWVPAVVATLLLMAYSTAYTAVAVPYGALTPVLTTDYDERTGLNAARMGWSMLGGLIAGIAMPVLIKSSGGYGLPGAVLGVCLVVPVLVTFWATRGRDVAVSTPGTAGLRAVLAVPAFRRTAIIFACAWSSIAVLSALVPFYVEWHLQAPQALDAVLAAIQLSAMLAIPVVAWAASKGEKHRTFAISVALWAVAMVALSLVPTGGLTPAIAVAITVGPGVAAAHVLPWAMLPDVIEQDRLATGEERAGAFYGAMTFIEKISTAVALQGMLGALQWVGYVPGGVEQSEAVVTAIRVGIGPVPAVVLIGVAIFAWNNPPVTRAEHAAALDKLAS